MLGLSQKHRRFTILIAMVSAGQIGFASAGAAQSQVCRQLLAQAKEVSAPASSHRAMKRSLARTLSQADRRGCFGGYFFRARGNACDALLRRIDRLEQMIQQPARPPRNKDWVQRELARNGCLKKPPVETADAASSEGYRTVCVRSCDGYFFPLGFSQSKSDFARHRTMCKGLDGSASADLYFYPSRNTVDEMVSVEGKAYAKQSFAFAYQREFRPACQAELKRGFEQVRDAFIQTTSKDAFRNFKRIPIPIPRPAAEDAVIANDKHTKSPPKRLSRIIPSFPVYLSESKVAPRETAEAGAAQRQSDPLGTILDLISPPAEAAATLTGGGEGAARLAPSTWQYDEREGAFPDEARLEH